MVDVTPSAVDYVAPAHEEDELYHPHSFLTKYVWSQDAKIIAIQYAGTATADWPRRAGAVLVDAAAARFPDTFSFISPEAYYQFITVHGMIMVIYLLTALFLGASGTTSSR